MKRLDSSNIKKYQKQRYNSLEGDSYISNFNDWGRGKLYSTWLKRKVSSFLEGKKLLLDIGCGPGQTIPYIINSHYIFGLDISHKFLKYVKKQNEGKNVFVICGDAEKLPFKKNVFDAVISIGTIHHLPSPMNAIMQISETLNNEGAFFYV